MVREHSDAARRQPSGRGRAQPVRTCVGCRGRATKSELLRVVGGVTQRGPAVLADPTGTAPGRGAYLHPTTECLELAVRRRAFARALRADGGLDSTPLQDHLRQLDTKRPPTGTGA